MEERVRELLLASDEGEDFEIPSFMDWENYSSRVHCVFEAMKERFENLFLDHTQDASYSYGISVRGYGPWIKDVAGNSFQASPYLAFSHFGRLATIFRESFLPELDAAWCVELLGQNQFNYVSECALETEYDGVYDWSSVDGRKFTWGNRFFDYS